MMTLPEAAQRKLAAIEQSAADADALADAAVQNISRLESERAALAREIDNGDAETEADRLETLHAEAARLSSEIADAKDALRGRQARCSNDKQICARLNDWLRKLPPDSVLHPIPAAPLDVPDDIPARLAAIRERITKARDVRRRVNRAALPLSELRKIAKDLVKDLAAKGRPRIEIANTLHVAFKPPASWSRSVHASHDDIAAMLAWQDPEGVERALLRDLEALAPPDDETLADQARMQWLAEIDKEARDLEALEEQLVMAALDLGLPVARRVNASPECVLGVVNSKAKARVAA